MKDEIFWGNLQGILKCGKWTLSLEEASALLQVYQEAIKRSKPPEIKIDEAPIKPIKKEKAKK